MTRPFTPAWLARDPAALSFLTADVDAPEARRAAVLAAPTMRPEVLSALRQQRPGHPALERLAQGAAVVVTGQQTGLFLGPLYTLTKAVSAVVAARALEAESGRPVVPVFWIQSEDADFDEVRSAAFPSGSAVGRVTLDAEPGLDRVSVAHRPLGPSVEHCLAQLELSGPEADATRALLTRHYTADRTLVQAFDGALSELTHDLGLLLVDPRTPELAPLAAPLHQRVLRDEQLEHLVVERAAALAAAGFDVQVPPRPGALLSCVHPDGVEGPRYRLLRGRDGLRGAGDPHDRRFDAAELAARLAAEPRLCSTTALLRPILQDTLLPTAGVVLGPGEIAYFAQMAPLYAAFDRAMPLVIPRGRLRCSVPASRRLAEALPLPAGPAIPPRAQLLSALSGSRGHGARFEALRTHVGAALAELASDAPDAARDACERTARSIDESLARLVARFDSAAAAQDAVAVDRLDRWLAWMAPDGAPQERVLGFAPFAARVGYPALVQRILEAMSPFSHELVELAL